MPTSTTDTLTQAQRTLVNIGLERNGRVELAPGVEVVRPTRDTEPEVVPLRTKYITADEAKTLHANSRPLARLNSRAKQLAEVIMALAPDRSQRARLQALREEIEQVERDTQRDARAAAQVPCIHVLDALIRRRAASYTAAVQLLADEVAMYEAAARLRNEIVGITTFDPMGLWMMVGSVLAPEEAHRPRGWSVTSDRWGNACLWTACSDSHRRAVEGSKSEIKAELQRALNGGWPF